MDYREMYFELFRVQSDTIDDLRRVTDKLREITDKMKIAHLAVEEMFLSASDDAERQES